MNQESIYFKFIKWGNVPLKSNLECSPHAYHRNSTELLPRNLLSPKNPKIIIFKNVLKLMSLLKVAKLLNTHEFFKLKTFNQYQ